MCIHSSAIYFSLPQCLALGLFFMRPLKYNIELTPKPTPRPRLGKYGVYNKSEYKKYQTDMMYFVNSLNIPKDDYSHLTARFYFPYPKKTSKKNRIDYALMRNKCDLDNLVKGLMDVLEKTSVINNDRQISSLFLEKRYTLRECGHIEFELLPIVNK